MTEGYEKLSNKLAPQLEKLGDLIINRQGFEAEVESVTNWLGNTENLLNTELKTTSLNAIQEQLDQVPILLFCQLIGNDNQKIILLVYQIGNVHR